MSQGWRRTVGNVRSFVGNSLGGLRGGANLASWAVAGTLAYFLWVKPSRDLKREQEEKAIIRTRPILEEAIEEVYSTMLPNRMVMVDLGCSSGNNTLLVVTQSICAIANKCRNLQREPPEIQFFLNDLPGNDFNSIFQSLDEYEYKLATKMTEEDVSLPPHYVAAISGSFYGRLFPRHSVPQELENGINDPSIVNKGNIYLWRTSPPRAMEAYQRQFQVDFSTFLRARYAEIAVGGRMVLSFIGRTISYPAYGELGQLLRLLAEAIADMVSEGIILEEKLDSLNLPLYTPLMEEVEEIILKAGEYYFELERSEIYELNWDPFDDNDDFSVFDYASSGKRSANCLRSVMEPLFKKHFGIEEDDDGSMLDDMFLRYSKNITRHLLTEKTKYPVFVLVLKAIK